MTVIECKICCTIPDKQTFVDCEECLKKVCTTCFSRLNRLKCPYCRHSYSNYYDHDMVHDDMMGDDFIPVPPQLVRQNAYDRGDFYVADGHGVQFHRYFNMSEPQVPPHPLEQVAEAHDPVGHYFNNNAPDILQEFRDDLMHRNRSNIRRNIRHYGVEFLEDRISLEDMDIILINGRQLYQQ